MNTFINAFIMIFISITLLFVYILIIGWLGIVNAVKLLIYLLFITWLILYLIDSTKEEEPEDE